MEKERIDNIIKMLNEVGIKAEVQETHGNLRLIVGEGTIRPSIKMEQLQDMSDEEIVLMCQKHLEEDTTGIMEQINGFYDWDTIKGKVRILLAAEETRPDVLTRPFLDLKMIPAIKVDMPEGGRASVKVTKGLLDAWNITEDELFETAKWNTKKKTIIRGIGDVVERMLDEAEIPDEMKDVIRETMYVPFNIMTTVDEFAGAAAMCCDGMLWPMANSLDKDIVIIPSSTEEVMLYPYDPEEGLSKETIKEMVIQTNSEIVEERGIKLSDSVYIYRRNKDSIEIFE